MDTQTQNAFMCYHPTPQHTHTLLAHTHEAIHKPTHTHWAIFHLASSISPNSMRGEYSGAEAEGVEISFLLSLVLLTHSNHTV